MVMTGQVTVSVYEVVAKQPLVSVTLTTIGNDPICVLLPLRMPVPELRLTPLVSEPESMVQLAVPRIPVALNVQSLAGVRLVPDIMLFLIGLVMAMVWQLKVRL